MKIKEAIRLLKQYNEEEEIIIAWWDKEEFDNAKEFETALDNEDCVDYTYNSAESTFGLGSLGGDGNCYETIFQLTSTLAIDEFGIPTDFFMYQNYPNPFNL